MYVGDVAPIPDAPPVMMQTLLLSRIDLFCLIVSIKPARPDLGCYPCFDKCSHRIAALHHDTWIGVQNTLRDEMLDEHLAGHNRAAWRLNTTPIQKKP
ncbi:MAG: hypothetical protein WA418_16855 [Bradyrhizobium sp.]